MPFMMPGRSQSRPLSRRISARGLQNKAELAADQLHRPVHRTRHRVGERRLTKSDIKLRDEHNKKLAQGEFSIPLDIYEGRHRQDGATSSAEPLFPSAGDILLLMDMNAITPLRTTYTPLDLSHPFKFRSSVDSLYVLGESTIAEAHSPFFKTIPFTAPPRPPTPEQMHVPVEVENSQPNPPPIHSELSHSTSNCPTFITEAGFQGHMNSLQQLLLILAPNSPTKLTLEERHSVYLMAQALLKQASSSFSG